MNTPRRYLRIGKVPVPEPLLLVARWIAVVGVVLSIAAFVLIEVGWISDPRYLTGALVLSFLGLVEMVAETTLRVRKVEASVDLVLAREEARTRPLDECVRELSREIVALRAAGTVDLRFLGLGLREGTSYVRSLLTDESLDCHLRLDILVITSDSAALEPWHAAVEPWCQQSEASIQQIEKAMSWVSENRPWLARTVRVKQYSEMPFIHGFGMTRPVEITYYGFCRWDMDDTYRWDSRSYHAVRGADTAPEDSPSGHDGLVFNSFFDHLWRVSGEPVLDSTTRGVT